MSRDFLGRSDTASPATSSDVNFEAEHDPSVSRRTSVAALRQIQKKLGGGEASEGAHDAAARGVASPTTSLPFADKIQSSFGSAHDVSNIQAHVGGDSASAMGASAYATGSHVVFDRSPDLHTAAHEAAHVVQQAQGVNLYGGVGEAGDHYERHADAVADRVVAGQSAADLLGAAPTGSASTAIQRKDITKATPQEHTDAHITADRDAGDAFSSKVDLLAVRMRSLADQFDIRRGGSDPRGPSGPIDDTRNDFNRVKDDADDLQRAATQEQSLSGPQKSVVMTDLQILAGAFARFDHALTDFETWANNQKDPLGVNRNAVRLPIDQTLKQFGTDLGSITSLNGNSRIDGKDVTELETTALKNGITALSTCTLAVRMNVKSATSTELDGDVSKLKEAVHQVKELISDSSVAKRIGQTTSLKRALDDLATLESELQTANPTLAKRFTDATYSFDVRTLHTFVRTHKPAKP
jgi:hypothetical protein